MRSYLTMPSFLAELGLRAALLEVLKLLALDLGK